MPSTPAVGIPKYLPHNEWVVMDELVTSFVTFWHDADRHINIVGGGRVKLKHEMSFPPYFWEVTLREGSHRFQLNEGWNKFVAMALDSDTWVGWQL